jgi:hypothetical protein
VRVLAAALCAALLVPIGAGAATLSRDALVARWNATNEASVAKIVGAKKRAAAQTLLDATRARMQAVPSQVPDPAALRRTAAAEIAHGYQLGTANAAPPPKTLWQQFVDWLGDRWNSLMKALFGKIHMSAGTGNILADLAIALFAGIVLFTGIRLFTGWQFERGAGRSSYRNLDPRASAHGLYLQACGLAQRGDFSGAVRTIFLAAIVALDFRGVVRDDASATVGEMRRVLRARDGDLVGAFDRVATPFVATAYAEIPVAGAEWESARAGYVEIANRGATS